MKTRWVIWQRPSANAPLDIMHMGIQLKGSAAEVVHQIKLSASQRLELIKYRRTYWVDRKGAAQIVELSQEQ